MNANIHTQVRSISLAIEKIITDLVFIFEELKYDYKHADKKNIRTIFTLKRKILNINDRILEIHTRMNTLLLVKKNNHGLQRLEAANFYTRQKVIDEIMNMRFHTKRNNDDQA